MYMFTHTAAYFMWAAAVLIGFFYATNRDPQLRSLVSARLSYGTLVGALVAFTFGEVRDISSAGLHGHHLATFVLVDGVRVFYFMGAICGFLWWAALNVIFQLVKPRRD
jgi:hypothetical protein